MERLWIGLGALAGVLGVGMAALGAHGGLDAAALPMLQIAAQMQMWHALALLAVGLWAARGGMLAELAGAGFAVGTLLFCGALYALALGGVRVPFAAPAGGMLLMLGWVLLGMSALWARPRDGFQ